MKKYGFFGGSFNPVTKAHIELAQEIVNKFKLNKVVFVPVGDNYYKPGLISEQHRFNMLKIATKEYNTLEVSDIELNQTKNLSTLEAFNIIEENFKGIERYYIIGADNLHKIAKSKDIDVLAKNYKYIVIEREDIDCNEIIASIEILKENHDNFNILENIKHNHTSATRVRKALCETEVDIDKLVNDEVLEYIKGNKLYL